MSDVRYGPAPGTNPNAAQPDYIAPRESPPDPLPAPPRAKTHEVVRLLRFFDYGHLPTWLQKVSRPFGDLARWTAEELPGGAETVEALRKLLESKDCAVRAVLETKT